MVAEVPAPTPGPDEVTIDVAFAGVGFVDTLFRAGAFPVALPYTPGIEAAGTVRDIGAGVDSPRPGQRVVALLNDFGRGPRAGGYAEVALASADMTAVVPGAVGLETASRRRRERQRAAARAGAGGRLHRRAARRRTPRSSRRADRNERRRRRDRSGRGPSAPDRVRASCAAGAPGGCRRRQRRRSAILERRRVAWEPGRRRAERRRRRSPCPGQGERSAHVGTRDDRRRDRAPISATGDRARAAADAHTALEQRQGQAKIVLAVDG